MFKNLTFHNILDDLKVSEGRKNVFRTIIEPITTKITELEGREVISSSDIEDFIDQFRRIFDSWCDPNLKDEHRKEVYKRLTHLMTEKIREWENF